VARFDIRTGAVLESFDVDSSIDGLAIYGERTAALTPGNAPVTYAAHAIDPNNHPVSYSLLGPGNGATLDPTTGVLSWTPPGPGTYTFTVAAADSLFPQLKATQTF